MQPTLKSFNNSIVVGSRAMNIDKFTDVNAFYHLYKRDAFKINKGMLHLFNRKRLMTTPILNMTELNNSVVYVNGPEGKFGYQVEYEIDFPYSLGNVNDPLNTNLGIDGQKFKFACSEDCFSPTDIITYDYQDGVTLYIHDDEVVREGDSFIYTVSIPQKGKRGGIFPIEKLKAGVQYFKITNANGEYDVNKSGISYRTGQMDLEVQMGGHRSAQHWITGYADMLEVKGDYGDNGYGRFSSVLDMNKSNAVLLFADQKNGKADWANARWMKRIEALLWAEMKMMEENDLTWNKGGIVQGSGRRSTRVNLGLFEQMKNGNYFEYPKLTLGLIESSVAHMYYNSGVPFEERRTEIQLGTGAMIEVSKLLFDDFKQSNPFVVNAGDVKGYLYGSAMNLGFGLRFTSKRFPVAGEIIFKHNPAFDARVNRTQDQMIGEFPIESHTLAIFDITNSSVSNAASKWTGKDVKSADGFNDASNVVLIKPKNWGSTYWGYKLGTHHPFGPNATQGMFSSDDRDGYGIWFKSFSSIWLKDAGRSMLLVKKRPGYLV